MRISNRERRALSKRVTLALVLRRERSQGKRWREPVRPVPPERAGASGAQPKDGAGSGGWQANSAPFSESADDLEGQRQEERGREGYRRKSQGLGAEQGEMSSQALKEERLRGQVPGRRIRSPDLDVLR